jgi:formylglycine-generating enzyme required for sulfatase activity
MRAAMMLMGLLAIAVAGCFPGEWEWTRGDTSVGETGPASNCPTGMRFIPANQSVMIGSTMGNPDEQPVHTVYLTAFCLDITEVTVMAYRACVTSAFCTAPGSDGACNWARSGREDHPINCVDWNQARAYCQRRGGDLPTEAQWEYAARWTDGRTYPWGNEAPGEQLCWSGTGARSTTCPVGLRTSGDSPFRISDMAGNVFEWTLDGYSTYAGDKSSPVRNPIAPLTGTEVVTRGGGCFTGDASGVRTTRRYPTLLSARVYALGFRCAQAIP